MHRHVEFGLEFEFRRTGKDKRNLYLIMEMCSGLSVGGPVYVQADVQLLVCATGLQCDSQAHVCFGPAFSTNRVKKHPKWTQQQSTSIQREQSINKL